MSILLHACCGPCAAYPVDLLLNEGRDTDLFWYNPNIHPEFEWQRRLENLHKLSDHFGVKLIEGGDLCMQEFWEEKTYLEDYQSRCHMCYDIRLDAVAEYAASHGYDSFCTTLLVSPYQQHDLIIKTANKKSEKYKVAFEYIDFRPGFRKGQQMAADMGLYRQKYCGCIFSLDESKFKEKIYRSFESGL